MRRFSCCRPGVDDGWLAGCHLAVHRRGGNSDPLLAPALFQAMEFRSVEEFSKNLWDLGLDDSLLSPDGLEYYGQLSLLKGGIRFADQINTVSPTYCQEIQTPGHGMGMDGLLRSRANQLHGLLNGLDGKLWSPAKDQALAHTYTPSKLSGKMVCKKELQQTLNLQVSSKTPIVCPGCTVPRRIRSF